MNTIFIAHEGHDHPETDSLAASATPTPVINEQISGKEIGSSLIIFLGIVIALGALIYLIRKFITKSPMVPVPLILLSLIISAVYFFEVKPFVSVIAITAGLGFALVSVIVGILGEKK